VSGNSETWLQFRNRCAATVQKIRDTKDDGVYAQLYAQDIERFVRMADDMSANWSTPESAFDVTEDP
jgi:hypothetical protein